MHAHSVNCMHSSGPAPIGLFPVPVPYLLTEWGNRCMRGYLVDQQHSIDQQQGVFSQQQMVVQHAFFAAAFPETPDDLYARGTKGVIQRERQRVTISPHAHLSTNTFFGRFPASYWQRSTDIARIEFRVNAQGTGRISIRTSDVAGGACTVAITLAEGANNAEVRLQARVNRYIDGAALWLEASTTSTQLVLESACWLLARRNQAAHPDFSPHRSACRWSTRTRIDRCNSVEVGCTDPRGVRRASIGD